MTRVRPGSLPLSTLMSAPLVEITYAFAANVGQERLSPRHGAEAVLATCSNVFWHLGDEAVNERELRERARVSKRALHFLVDQARRSGWVAVEPPGAGASKRIQLTSAGRTVANECAQHLAEAEQSFRARIGEDRYAPLRISLETLVSKLDLELPHYPVGYGPADATITGGGARFGRGAMNFDAEGEQRAVDEWEAESRSRLDVRSIGQDWSPVPRGDGDTVSSLSLTALLSEALVAFTIDYEGSGGLSLAYTADLVRHIEDEGIEIKLRPARGAEATGEIPVHWAFAGLRPRVRDRGHRRIQSASRPPPSHREGTASSGCIPRSRGRGRTPVAKEVRRIDCAACAQVTRERRKSPGRRLAPPPLIADHWSHRSHQLTWERREKFGQHSVNRCRLRRIPFGRELSSLHAWTFASANRNQLEPWE